MGDIYRLVTMSGSLILYELDDDEHTAVAELLATGTGDYDVYRAEDLKGDCQSWMILA
jgi:hypothetical protein